MSTWSPETGFEDDINKTPYCFPLITEEGDRIWFDLGNHEEVRKKCEEAKVYFPKGVLDRTDKRNFLFPMYFFKPSDEKQEEFRKLFYTEEIEKKGHMFLFESRVVPFYIHTPTLFAMLMPGKVLKHMICTEVIYQYFCILQNLIQKNEDEQGLFNPTMIIDTVLNDSIDEMREYERMLTANLCGCGMMQNYFTDKRHVDAPKELVKLFIQYTFRVIQNLERQILKLTPLNYKPGKSDIWCSSAILPTKLNEEETTRVKVTSSMFIESNFMVPTIEKLLSKTAPNKELDNLTLVSGVCLEYCENILWLSHQMFDVALNDVKETEEE